MTSARAAAMPAHMTAEQLLELPDDGHRHELIRGELQTMAPAGGQHGQVAFAIGRLVGNHVYENKLGRCYAAETGFVLRRDPDTVRAPDLAFVASAGLSSRAQQRVPGRGAGPRGGGGLPIRPGQ